MEGPQSIKTEMIKIRGMDCAKHTWKPSSGKPRGIAVVYHGFLAHSLYPTVRYAAEMIADKVGFDVIAVDLPGHGKSEGMRGYVSSASVLVKDGLVIAEEAYKVHGDKMPLYFVGSSMGGAIALAVAEEFGDKVAGVVLLAPMLSLDVAEPLKYVLKGLSYVVPTFALIPSSATSSEHQYRDPEKRRECDDDELTVSGANLRTASASACVEFTSLIQSKLKNVTCPFICLVADEDVVVNNDGALKLMEQAQSTDKTIKHYAALHGLLCEPSPLLDEIQSDIQTWLTNHTLSWHSKHRTLV
mmetsp:Transcript_5887/g.8330  ORF Transcript_5887/g.8330 Transcript_5887/m.8330 type:complete len:300 (+) Transcript_5887:205-1104(+)